MIDKIEKICHGFCGLAVLVVAGLYIWQPVPDTYPREFIPTSIVSKTPPKKLMTPRDPKDPKTAALTQDKITGTKNLVINELKKASPRPGALSARNLDMKYLQIPKHSFNFIKNEANWLPELKLAKSVIKTNKKDGSKCLQLTKIKEDSLLRSVVGLENDDVIELINGERWDFSSEASLDYRNQALKMMEEVESGGTISLTITRDKKPQHITFSLLE
jgi:hypothetical protein